MTHSFVWFFNKFFFEITFTTRFVGIGILYRSYPACSSVSLAIPFIRMVVGQTLEPRERRACGLPDRRQNVTHIAA